MTEFTDSDYYFIMDKGIVNEKVLPENLVNYEESLFSSDFLVDKGTIIANEDRNLLKNSDLESFFDSFKQSEMDGLDNYLEFGFTTVFEDENYELIFDSIQNIEGENAAYLISITNSTATKELYQQFLSIAILIAILYLISLVLVSIVISNRNLLESISYSDGLTNIYNRRKFEIDLNAELLRNKRNRTNISFIMFDIDYFKKVNDNYGHKTGDYVLETLSSIISGNIREGDCFARYGWEEFIIMLLNSDKEESRKKAEELRKLVENHIFGKAGQITISLGVYQLHDADNYDIITENVDKAMYKAKEGGRNRVHCCE